MPRLYIVSKAELVTRGAAGAALLHLDVIDHLLAVSVLLGDAHRFFALLRRVHGAGKLNRAVGRAHGYVG